jgi:DNA invertase Pin-like site-specific DNA recombinase
MRISTKEERGNQKYNRQEAALKKFAEETGIEYVAEFREDVSGKSFENRKEWQRLEKLVQSGDTIVFKEISRFTREAVNGFAKYMELLEKGVELIFLDNATVSTEYIKNLLRVAEQQSLVAKTSLEGTVKLLIIVELDRAEQERLTLIKRITQGMAASEKKQGRKTGSIDKMTPELEEDIKAYLNDRSIKQVDIMKKHNISRNTLKKYADLVKEK